MSRRYALVVGISDYTLPLKHLTKTARDAETMAQVLEDYGEYQVTRLIGSISRERLIQALRVLLLKQATGQDALIYFTGHGLPVINALLGDTEAFLATSDTRVVLNGKQLVQQQNGISFHDLNGLLQKSQLSSFVMLLDACHSGDLIESIDKRVVQETLNAFAGRDYYLITACRGFEQAYARRSEAHSIFTGALLEGLSEEQANAEGEINAEVLAAFVKRALQGSGQEPISLGSGGIINLVSYYSPAITKMTNETCPYQGLEPFTEATRQFFFGRQSTVERLHQAVEQSNVVLLVGASGSGKSSVVRAGLIPALRSLGWQVLPPIKPGFEPMGEMKRAIAQLAHRRDEIQAVHEAIAHQSLAGAIAHLPGTDRLLLLVDQFEEVFTVCTVEAEQRQFIERLTESIGQRLAIVITLRADFVEACLQYPSLTHHLQQHAIYMPPLDGADLETAIQKPALSQGYRIDPALISMISRDMAAEPNCLPLLQFALERLWEPATRVGHHLTLTQYEQLGGVKGALNAHADRVYGYRDWRSPTPQVGRSTDEKEWIRRICLRLVRTGSDIRDTRQRRTKAELLNLAGNDHHTQVLLETVLEDLVEGRLLVSGEQESTSYPVYTGGLGEERSRSQPNSTAIDLAHEALMEGWEAFVHWRETDRDMRRLIDRIDDAHREWKQHYQNPDFLLPKALMIQAEALTGYLEQAMPPDLHSYYQASVEHEHNRTAAVEWAQLERDLRDETRRLQNALRRQGIGEKLVATLSLVQHTLKVKPQRPPLTWGTDVLPVGLATSHEQQRFQGHEDYVRGVAFAPDGEVIVSGSDDRTIRLWNQEGTPIGKPFQGHDDYVLSVAFSPDGQHIASGSADRTLRLWDRAGNPVGLPFRGHESAVLAVAFSPDGGAIASASADQSIRLWSLSGTPLGAPLQGHKAAVRAVAFSPDGTTIASGSDDRTILCWKPDGTPVGAPFCGHESAVLAVAFSPDGQRLVSAGGDRTVRLWERDGIPIGAPLRGHKSAVLSVTYSPDGKTIASGSEDRTIRLWSRDGIPAAPPFQGHEDYVRSVAFSPDGQTLVSGSADRTIRLWKHDGTPIAPPFAGHEDYIRSVAVSPKGDIIASGGDDRTIRLWNPKGTPLAPPLQGHEDYVRSIAFSPDGQFLASGSDDRTLRLWSSHNGQPLQAPLRGHEAAVLAITFSPDGKFLASGSADRTIRLWQTHGDHIGAVVGEPFQGHSAAVLSLAFSPDGQILVSGGGDRTIRLWRSDGTPIRQPFQGHEDYVRAVAFSPDGRLIISAGDDRTIRLWNRDGTPHGKPFQGHEDYVRAIAFSPDGQIIASGSADCTVCLWNLDGTLLHQPLQGHKADVRAIAFTPDGQTLVSAGDDCTIRLWNRDGTPIRPALPGSDTSALSVAFSPDGQTIVRGSLESMMRLWRGGTWQDWVRLCCEQLRQHPMFNNPPNAAAREACEFCREFLNWDEGQRR